MDAGGRQETRDGVDEAHDRGEAPAGGERRPGRGSFDSGVAGPADDVLAVGVEFGHIQVGVGIDEGGALAFIVRPKKSGKDGSAFPA